MSPLTIKLVISEAALAAETSTRVPLAEFRHTRDVKGASPRHPTQEKILTSKDKENAPAFECAHPGCGQALTDLAGAFQHYFTCVSSPLIPPPAFARSLANLGNLFWHRHFVRCCLHRSCRRGCPVASRSLSMQCLPTAV